MDHDFFSPSELLWKPLFEAAAQTIVGALGAYSFGKLISRVCKSHHYEGGMDIWVRGIRAQAVDDGDNVIVDGLLSPYAQLFPGDPAENAKRWNSLHSFPGKITSAEYQTLEFLAGSDAALRTASLNGESLVGIYNRYGFVGEGMVGVVPTKLLLKAVPDIFKPGFVGVHARISARLARCPSQHAFVAQSIAASAGMALDVKKYKNLPYVHINCIKPYSASRELTTSLLGSVWIATHVPTEQYVSEYGYFTDAKERQECVARLWQSKAWKKAAVYFDDLACPSKDLSFKKLFL